MHWLQYNILDMTNIKQTQIPLKSKVSFSVCTYVRKQIQPETQTGPRPD